MAHSYRFRNYSRLERPDAARPPGAAGHGLPRRGPRRRPAAPAAAAAAADVQDAAARAERERERHDEQEPVVLDEVPRVREERAPREAGRRDHIVGRGVVVSGRDGRIIIGRRVVVVVPGAVLSRAVVVVVVVVAIPCGGAIGECWVSGRAGAAVSFMRSRAGAVALSRSRVRVAAAVKAPLGCCAASAPAESSPSSPYELSSSSDAP